MTNRFRLEDIEIEKIGKPEIKGSYDFKKQNYLKQDRTFCFWQCGCENFECDCNNVSGCTCQEDYNDGGWE